MLNESQLVKLLSVTTTDILSQAGDLVEYHVLGVQYGTDIEMVSVTFEITDTALPHTMKSQHIARFTLPELEEWLEDAQKFLVNVEFRLAESIKVKGGGNEICS